MPSDPVTAATLALSDLGGQRVWSLLVSVFGDLARNKGDAIDGPVLSAIMTEMNIRPEATRVALHRLRNDNWITSKKIGRTSSHSLTAHGLRESAIASPRIYGTPDDTPRDWVLLALDPDQADDRADLLARGFVAIAPRLYVGADTTRAPADGLCLRGTEPPDWLRQKMAAYGAQDDYSDLLTILQTINTALPPETGLSPLNRAVLRCLIVHNWRRLVLRHPDLPRALYPDNWSGHKCRALVSALLDRFDRPNLREIAG